MTGAVIEIAEPGAFATVQDLGRPGHTRLGVPASGAFDRGALSLANRLVGNASDSPGVEFVLGGLSVRATRATTIALTGAPCPGVPWNTPVTVRAGRTITLGRPPLGLRSYLAVRGGLAVDAVLGSMSTDTLSGLGPAPLAAGDRIMIGTPSGEPGDSVPVGRPAGSVLDVRLGPRDDWFTTPAVHTLVTTGWTVRSKSDRVGVRLDGPSLERSRTGELPSEAVLPGAVQVPGDGRPIVFGPDAPVTGGYPVIGVVANLDAAAQLRPGDTVRFRLLR